MFFTENKEEMVLVYMMMNFLRKKKMNLRLEMVMKNMMIVVKVIIEEAVMPALIPNKMIRLIV